MPDLQVIDGDATYPARPYRVLEVHEDSGGGFQIVTPGEVGRLDNGSITRLDNCIGWKVADGDLARAFCEAMNDQYERDGADEPPSAA